jgi:hypothetical protein
MIAYVCVYRHFVPNSKDRAHAEASAASNPLLHAFLEGYDRSYFDWGDDPGFFAAEQLLGNVRLASWGVCRSDVRGALKEGDFVVFFVGRESDDGSRWDYHWVGIGTIKRRVQDRRRIWTEASLKHYRGFLNLLVASDLSHHEFFPPHADWEKRIKSPYLLFDPDLSRFNLAAPLHVSTYTSKKGVPDRWKREDHLVRKLETLLFGNRNRRLRTSPTCFGHAKLPLSGTDEEMLNLRSELLRLFDSRGPVPAPMVPDIPAGRRTILRRRGCG